MPSRSNHTFWIISILAGSLAILSCGSSADDASNKPTVIKAEPVSYVKNNAQPTQPLAKGENSSSQPNSVEMVSESANPAVTSRGAVLTIQPSPRVAVESKPAESSSVSVPETKARPLTEIEKENTQLKKDVQKIRNQMHQLKVQLDQTTRAFDFFKPRFEEQSHQLNSYKDTVTELEHQLEIAKKQLEGKGISSDFITRNNNAEVETLKKEKDQLKIDNDVLLTESNNHKDRICFLEEQISLQETRIARLNGIINHSDDLLGNQGQLQADNQNLTSELNRTQQELALLRGQNERLQRLVSVDQSFEQGDYQRIKALEESLSQIKANYYQKELMVTELSQENQRLRQRLLELEKTKS